MSLGAKVPMQAQRLLRPDFLCVDEDTEMAWRENKLKKLFVFLFFEVNLGQTFLAESLYAAN